MIYLTYVFYCYSGPTPTVTDLGCHVDSGRRDLSGKMYQHGGNTPETCIAFCEGYNYAGVQVSFILVYK